MLNAVICEDNSLHRKQIQNMIENLIIKNLLDIDIVLSTGEPNDVIKYMNSEKRNNKAGIYFLDVDLQSKINGIKLAEIIRDNDASGFIIFITTHSEMSFLTFEYKIEAMDYILKDRPDKIKEELNKCIMKAYNSYYNNNCSDKFISVETNDRVVKIKLDDILFIDTSDKIHKVRIHEINRQVEFYGTLKDLESSLTEDFCRCYKSTIVNSKKIKEIDKKNLLIYMINGETCYVSTRYLKELLR